MRSLSGRAPCAISPASNTALVSGINSSASATRRKTESRPRRSRHNCQVAGSLIARISDLCCQKDANPAQIAANSWFYVQLTLRIVGPCYHFRVALIRFVQRACVQTCRRKLNKIRRPTITRKSGGGAVADHSEAAPGDFYGGHRCRELCHAHCLLSCLHFSSQVVHSHTTAGSTRAATRTAPAIGAAATTTAKDIRGRRPPHPAGWSTASM